MITIFLLYELIFIDNLRHVDDLYLRTLLYTTIKQVIDEREPLDDNNMDNVLLRLDIVYSYICALVDENQDEDLVKYANLVFADIYGLIKSRLELVKKDEDIEIYRANDSICYEIHIMYPYSIIMRTEDKTNYSNNKNKVPIKVVTYYDN